MCACFQLLPLPLTLAPHVCFPAAVCERVGTPGEALLEAFKPRPYTELVGGKTMAQVGRGSVGMEWDGGGRLCRRGPAVEVGAFVGAHLMEWQQRAACGAFPM